MKEINPEVSSDGHFQNQIKLNVPGSLSKEEAWTNLFEVFFDSGGGWSGGFACFIGVYSCFFLGILYRLCIYVTVTGIQFEALGATVSMGQAVSQDRNSEMEP